MSRTPLIYVVAVERSGDQPGIAGFVGTAQQRLDPRHQFDQRERLGQVIVAARAQSPHSIVEAAERAQHQRRGAAPLRTQPRDQIEPINRLLMDLLMKYVMHHPQLVRLGNLPAMGFIMINGGVFTVIRYLTEPNPTVTFDDLVRGLGDMVAHFVDGELQRADSAD